MGASGGVPEWGSGGEMEHAHEHGHGRDRVSRRIVALTLG